VGDMQKLVGKLARLGEGAPWIYKLMSHLYTSLAFALKSNAELLEKSSSSSGFRKFINQIALKNFSVSGKQSDNQRHVISAMKKAAKMINKHGHLYLVNCTMRDKLTFLSQALSPDSGIKFETPIAHLIPRTPAASIIGDSSLLACGGYSITLKFWWHLSFPKEVIERAILHLKINSDETGDSSLLACGGYSITLKFWWHLSFPKEIIERELLHLKNNSDETFISINCLEYVTTIINRNTAISIRVLAGTKNSRPVGFYSRNSTKSTVNPNTTIPQI
jgi:hypothetical protein